MATSLTLVMYEKIEGVGQRVTEPLARMPNEAYGAMIMENIRIREILNALQIK